jgi:hypothetical protein
MTQFIHLSTYGRVPRKGEPRWAHAVGILQEGGRAANAVAHLSNPSPPTLLYNERRPEDLIAPATELAASACDAQGRALRRDGAVLGAGVVGFPDLIKDMVLDPVNKDLYLLWRTETVDWLANRFAGALRSIVEHVDEDRLHLHFYTLPILNRDHTLDWTRAHPGLAAKRRAAAAGQSKIEQERQYRAAMRELQDDFHRSVSQLHGHTRYGPRRERTSRMERGAQKRLEAMRAEMVEQVQHENHNTLWRAEQEARQSVSVQQRMILELLDESSQKLALERNRADRAEAEIERLLAMMGVRPRET